MYKIWYLQWKTSTRLFLRTPYVSVERRAISSTVSVQQRHSNAISKRAHHRKTERSVCFNSAAVSDREFPAAGASVSRRKVSRAWPVHQQLQAASKRSHRSNTATCTCSSARRCRRNDVFTRHCSAAAQHHQLVAAKTE